MGVAAAAEKSPLTNDLPPAYTSAATEADATPSAAPPEYAPGSSPYPHIPLALNIYTRRWKATLYNIGQHADQPSFELKVDYGMSKSKPFLVLHNTSSELVASVTSESITKGHAVITVPGRPGSSQNTISERLEVKYSFPLAVFSFSFDVGRGKETHREAFEWRFSKGKEVKVFGAWSTGWKLVRLDREAESGPGEGSSRSERLHGQTSDGKPVVAVVADNMSPSTNKIAKFHFVGAGATGEMGEEWAFMALMTAVRVWERSSQNACGK